MTKRVFTYGCSVTQHIWPTWADIVCHSAIISGYSGFNAGLSGSGNTGIKRSVIQTHEKYGISSKDLVLVMWTSWLREDRLTFLDTHTDPRKKKQSEYPQFTRCGNVLNTPFYNHNFINDYFNVEHYIINSISEITTIRKAVDLCFEGHISVDEGFKQAHEKNLVDSTSATSTYATFISDLGLPNQFRLMLDGEGKHRARETYSQYNVYYDCDGHPVPQHALDYVLTTVAPNLPFDILPETIEWVELWNKRMLAELEYYSSDNPGTEVLVHRMRSHREQWTLKFHNMLIAEQQAMGIRTSPDLWGGTNEYKDSVDTNAMLKQFIRSNKFLG